MERVNDVYYPFLDENCSIEIGNGWIPILEHVLMCIGNMKIDIKISQVKEKFGLLRIYYNGEGDDFIDGVIAFSEIMSGIICEECGSTKGVRKGAFNGYWLKTFCEECILKEKYNEN